MIPLRPGAKITVRVEVKRQTGSGAVSLTTQQRRIVDASKTLITGFDWSTCTWTPDDANESGILSALFDSTAVGLTAVGRYFVEFRGVIGPELYKEEVMIEVTN